ncbi:MAG: aminotransferase class V-fold PLP-dependent enzyme, partial [Arenicellales bacterium]
MKHDLTALTPEYLRSQTIGIDAELSTPFGKRLMVYADYTASGRSLKFVEEYILQLQVLYANSHTEDDITGRTTTELLHQAEAKIKAALNAGESGRIVACGTGATGAIDRMQQIIGVRLPAATKAILQQLCSGFLGEDKAQVFADYQLEHQPVVFVGPYEHHSNEVAWREGLATVVEVRLADDGSIDLTHLESLLQAPEYQNRLRIGSFSAASNVTGMRSDVLGIARLLHQYDALVLFDYAASAPYVPIDMNPENEGEGEVFMDAVFISPHKFLGGPGTSGVLVFNERCYHRELAPSLAAGGTVDYVSETEHSFINDIEAREKGGTPGILQTLKAALVFEIKAAVGEDKIEALEHEMTQRAMTRWQANANIEVLGNTDPTRRIGILSFNIKTERGGYLHPRFITTLLDDLFGIQTRAGCSCAGPYGHHLLGIDQAGSVKYRQWVSKGFDGIKPGWCRLGFHYSFDAAEVDYLIDAVTFVADCGHRFQPLYDFNVKTGLWQHRDFTPKE